MFRSEWDVPSFPLPAIFRRALGRIYGDGVNDGDDGNKDPTLFVDYEVDRRAADIV